MDGRDALGNKQSQQPRQLRPHPQIYLNLHPQHQNHRHRQLLMPNFILIIILVLTIIRLCKGQRQKTFKEKEM